MLWLGIAVRNKLIFIFHHLEFITIKSTLIIGGGLSGLSTAYFLKKKGIPFTLLEKENRYGGVIKSFKNQRQIWDRAAISFSMTPEIQEVISDLGLESDLVHASENSNSRYIFRRGKLRKLTSSPASIFTSPLLSWKAKFRILRESSVKSKSPKGETVADFVSRRFGREMYESVANPVLAGIYAGDPEKMEAAVVLKQFLEYENEYGSLIKGFKANKGKNKRIISSFKNGTGLIIDAMYEALKEHCVSDSSVVTVEKSGASYAVKTDSGKEYVADRIISCIPSYMAGEIFIGLDAELSSKLSSIPYSELNMSHLTFRKEDVKGRIEGFGFLFPEVEKKPLLGAVINSSAFNNRAEEENMTFTVFSKPSLGQSPEGAETELKKLLNISVEPVFRHLSHWKKGIPQFNVGHSEILESIKEFEKKENIIISGNYRSGVSVGDCVKFAYEI